MVMDTEGWLFTHRFTDSTRPQAPQRLSSVVSDIKAGKDGISMSTANKPSFCALCEPWVRPYLVP